MTEVQDKNEGGMSFKTAAPHRVNHAAMKRKPLSQEVKHSRAARARVNIGVAFERWRAVKAAKGLRSDAELAVCLLDEMKRSPPRSPSPGPSDKKIKLSQSEVQLLIEREVCNAVKRNESKLEALIESIQNLDHGVDYECSIQKLEARIDMMSRRAEAVLAYVTQMQKKSSSPSLSNTDILSPLCSINPEDRNVDTALQNKGVDYLDKSGKFFQIVEMANKALQKLHEDNKDLKAAIADLREDSPPVLTPQNSPKFMGSKHLSKKELNIQQHQENDADKFEIIDKPTACLSSSAGNVTKDTGSQELLYPPLPPVSFPSTLNMEAISYCIPPRLEVHLALIRDPAGLSVLWREQKEDPSAPPMDSYSIYMTTEKTQGSGIFPDWTLLGEVKAFALPMCVMIKKYKRGHKILVTVVGKDIFGRYGPYSQVVTTVVPGSL